MLRLKGVEFIGSGVQGLGYGQTHACTQVYYTALGPSACHGRVRIFPECGSPAIYKGKPRFDAAFAKGDSAS